jgi:SAM-dependent methyltransferase
MQSRGDVDYSVHGIGYANRRQTDPRIEARVHHHLADARTVLNVGAGAGSYEPLGRYVAAVEPSATMRAQRPSHLAPAIEAFAESLPFDDNAFDAAMAMVTIHQWSDWRKGLTELTRVARRSVIILTFDPAAIPRFWLNDYAPEVLASEVRRFPTLLDLTECLGGQTMVEPVRIPIDCTDGFMEAFYARPECFLDPEVRGSQSAWTFVGAEIQERAIQCLKQDLESGAWDRRYGHLRSAEEYEGSLTLVVSQTQG